jgi:hypothetical protein
MLHEYKIISVYADSNGDILILSCGESKKWGGTIEIDVEQRLNAPFTLEELESKLMLSFTNCFSKELDENSKVTAIEKILKIKGYSKAVKNKKLVHVDWDVNEGYSVIPTDKIPKRGYVHQTSNVILIPLEYKKNTLADAVIKAISLSSI